MCLNFVLIFGIINALYSTAYFDQLLNDFYFVANFKYLLDSIIQIPNQHDI